MPCGNCGHTRIYDEKRELLYCPSCTGVAVEKEDVIHQKVAWLKENFINEPNLISLLEGKQKFRVFTELVHQLNRGAGVMLRENRLEVERFFHTLPLLRQAYRHPEIFDPVFDPETGDEQDEVVEIIDVCYQGVADLLPVLSQLEEDFAIPVPLTPGHGDKTDFFGNYDFKHSEYWWCSERCLRAVIGGREENRGDAINTLSLFRTFNEVKSVSESEEIDSVYEFADFWMGFIASMGFTATLDDTLADSFTPDVPADLTIFEIQELLGTVNYALQDQIQERDDTDHRSLHLHEDDFDQCGRLVFEDRWEKIRRFVLVSEDHPDAHPFFFHAEFEKLTNLPNWRQPREQTRNLVLYPDKFAKLLKFQVFPLLENGENNPASRDVFDDVNGKRGPIFEQNIVRFLRNLGLEVFHSCKTTKRNGNELDAIFPKNETLYYVELKHLLPELNMQTREGVENVDRKFDELIFNSNNGQGKSFPEKVDTWQDLAPGDKFTHKPEDADSRESHGIPPDWGELNSENLVVSNLVPSFIEKQDVRFITDLELYQWIYQGKDVFTSTLH